LNPGAQVTGRYMAATHRDHTPMRSVGGALVLGGPVGASLIYNATSIEFDDDGGMIVAGGIGFDDDLGSGGAGTHWLVGGAFHLGFDVAHSPPGRLEAVPTLELHAALNVGSATIRVGPFGRLYEREGAPDSWCAGLRVELALVERQAIKAHDAIGDHFHW
jgi:hypothetical protein